MQLNDEQKKVVIQHLKKHNIAATCSVCNDPDMSLNDTVFELREFFSGNRVVGGNAAVVPVIVATCKTCGNMLLFNAIILGIVPADKENVSRHSSLAVKHY